MSNVYQGPAASDLSDEDLLDEIELIVENLQECGSNSAYAFRCKPRLRDLKAEARKRGIELR